MTSFALSIVIPVYNGARSIGPLVAALAGLEVPGGHEIVLVNDNSPDDSLDVCRGLIRKTRVPVTLVDLARNYGEHNAVMAGLRQARGSHVITMDDDLQNPPGEVLNLLRHAQQTGADLVYAKPIEKQHAGWRNLGSRFTNRVADFVLDKPKGLYLSSFRCISAFAASQATSYDGPFPYIDGLLVAGDAAHRKPRGRASAAPATAAATTICAGWCGCGSACSSISRSCRCGLPLSRDSP